MKKPAPVFGSCLPGIVYNYRRAAYLVATNESGAIATVRGWAGYFLPGGGCLDNETAEQTIHREVLEEIACCVELTGTIGEAIQYFFAASDDCDYCMHASFFTGRLTKEPGAALAGEQELLWLPPQPTERLFFHECHDWAVGQLLNRQEGAAT